MIGSLRGRLASRRPDNVLVDVGGIGYQVNLPLTTLSALPPEGHEVFLHVYTHVREDALTLFGFASESEKKIFITLLGVSGIGPKVALNILSGISTDALLVAIESEDVAQLCRVPGLGKKTAHRLILELKEKLPSSAGGANRLYDDALSALVNLGYRKTDAQSALDRVVKQGGADIETLLRETLKQLTGNGA